MISNRRRNNNRCWNIGFFCQYRNILLCLIFWCLCESHLKLWIIRHWWLNFFRSFFCCSSRLFNQKFKNFGIKLFITQLNNSCLFRRFICPSVYKITNITILAIILLEIFANLFLWFFNLSSHSFIGSGVLKLIGWSTDTFLIIITILFGDWFRHI